MVQKKVGLHLRLFSYLPFAVRHTGRIPPRSATKRALLAVVPDPKPVTAGISNAHKTMNTRGALPSIPFKPSIHQPLPALQNESNPKNGQSMAAPQNSIHCR